MPDHTVRTAYYAEKPIAVVIGCGNMGMGCARALGARNPLLLVDINKSHLNSCVATLRYEGYSVSGYQCDITAPDQIRGLVDILEFGPGVRVLAHVAAIAGAGVPWRTLMTVDLIGAHFIANAICPHIVRGGIAILISSMGSYQSPNDPRINSLLDDPCHPDFFQDLVVAYGREPDYFMAYFMAKQGVNRLARKLAVAWGKNEVRALSVSPGLIDSAMGRSDGDEIPLGTSGDEKILGSRDQKACNDIPLGRQGTILEVTAAVDFLASDAASFINGIDIPIDGGANALARARNATRRRQ